jgi:hypothetical protein
LGHNVSQLVFLNLMAGSPSAQSGGQCQLISPVTPKAAFPHGLRGFRISRRTPEDASRSA